MRPFGCDKFRMARARSSRSVAWWSSGFHADHHGWVIPFATVTTCGRNAKEGALRYLLMAIGNGSVFLQ